MTDSQRERLRRTLTAQGIRLDASVSETLDPSARLRASLASGVCDDLAPPDDIDPDFQIMGELGRGGMAVVWLADQLPLAREVAIKRACDPSDPEASLLLLREALIMGQLEHPNIVPVHALISVGMGPAVVMKRLSGSTWDALLRAGDRTLERDLEILVQVVNAVSFAHSRGIVHRDIKPENVMLGAYGEVYLLDWGVAARASDPPSDAIVGTPRYLAPEMAEGLWDARTDVFLLGATLHEVLTGEPRHRGESALEVLYAAMNVTPFDYGSEVPEELAAICNRACARDPDARYPSASALREAIVTFREHRAAAMLSEAAEAKLRALVATTQQPDASNTDVQQLFSQTRLGFEAALEIWADSPAARAGLASCLRTMVGYELAARRPDAALALLGALEPPDPALEAEARALGEALAQEQARLLAMERDRDPRVGAPDRRRAYRAIALGILVVALSALVQRQLFPAFRPSTGRLTVVGAVILVMVSGVIAWWRTHGPFNFINRRIAEICISTLAVSFTSRLSGYILSAAPEQVLVNDSFLLGLGGAALSPYHRAGPWLAGLSFFVAVVGSIWPGVVDKLFIALSVGVAALALALGRVDALDEHDMKRT